MIYKVIKAFKYSPSDDVNFTEFEVGDMYEFEVSKKDSNKMTCMTKLWPECNNGYDWPIEFFDEHFRKVDDESVVMYSQKHFLNGRAIQKMDQFGNYGQYFKTNTPSQQIFNDAINHALSDIDKIHEMDMNNLLSSVNFLTANNKLLKTTLQRIVNDPSEQNIECAKIILEHV